jgi:hypothetical protein
MDYQQRNEAEPEPGTHNSIDHLVKSDLVSQIAERMQTRTIDVGLE